MAQALTHDSSEEVAVAIGPGSLSGFRTFQLPITKPTGMFENVWRHPQGKDH